MTKVRLAILGSTRGTNLEPIVKAIQEHKLNAEIKIVLSNKKEAGILMKAKTFHLPTLVITPCAGETRAQYDQRLIAALAAYEIDLVVLIGFMRILSKEFIAHFRERIINVHPSLLPKYKGLMDLAAHQAVLDHHERETGCTVHIVTEELDSGKILIQNCCKVDKNDNKETLKARVQALESPALIAAIKLFSKESS